MTVTSAPTILGRPYVGVTGITSTTEADQVLTAADALGWSPKGLGPHGHRLMLGVLVSAKTLSERPITNRRYPTRRWAAEVVDACARSAYATVHYNSRVTTDLAGQLAAVVETCPALHGIQLNLIAPDPAAIATFRAHHPQVDVILQLNRSVWKADRADRAAAVTRAVEYTARYAPSVTHVLIDASGGRGTPMDSVATAALADALQATASTRHLRIAVAGGLGPNARNLLGALFAHPHGVAVDAESRVRIPASDPIPGEPFQDILSPNLVAQYLAEATDALQSVGVS